MANVTQALASLPSCVIVCLSTGFAEFGCGLANARSCFCPNIPLQTQLSGCVQSSCNSTEQAIATYSNQALCQGIPIQSKQAELKIVLVLCSVLVFVSFALRCLSRWRISRTFGADDWILLSVVVTMVPNVVVVSLMIGQGFGLHIWNIDPANVQFLLKLFYTSEVLYAYAQMVTKISIIFFYLRVFSNPRFRFACWMTNMYLSAHFIVFFFLIVFQCSPVSFFWNNSVRGTCLSINLISYLGAGFSIAEDIFIVLLPLPEILKLDLTLRKKIHLGIMFFVGSFACIRSMVRLKYLISFSHNFSDPTYDNSDVLFWSFLEVCVAIICANLPPIRPLFSIWLPSLFGSVEGTTNSGSGKTPSTIYPVVSNAASNLADFKRPYSRGDSCENGMAGSCENRGDDIVELASFNRDIKVAQYPKDTSDDE